MVTDTLHQALRLPYSVGAHRLLREILSVTTGTPLPTTEPPVRHGPIQQPRIPKRCRAPLSPKVRRDLVLQALKAGPVTRDTPLDMEWPHVVTAVCQLRRAGHPVTNKSARRRDPACYVMEMV